MGGAAGGGGKGTAVNLDRAFDLLAELAGDPLADAERGQALLESADSVGKVLLLTGQ